MISVKIKQCALSGLQSYISIQCQSINFKAKIQFDCIDLITEEICTISHLVITILSALGFWGWGPFTGKTYEVIDEIKNITIIQVQYSVIMIAHKIILLMYFFFPPPTHT